MCLALHQSVTGGFGVRVGDVGAGIEGVLEIDGEVVEVEDEVGGAVLFISE